MYSRSEWTAFTLRVQVNLDGYALPIKKLKGTEPVESLDLSGKNLHVASAIVIASLISVNGSLTSLDLSKNQLCGLDFLGRGTFTIQGITAIADALRVNGALTKMKYVTFRSAPSSHILPLTLPAALCNLTTRPLLPSVCVQPLPQLPR